MKEIRETKMVEQTTVKFVANDGKEFESEMDCVRYESQQNEDRCKADFIKIGGREIELPFVKWYQDYAQAFIVTLNSDKDYYIVQDYFKSWPQYMEFNMDKPKSYPHTAFILSSENYASEYAHINLKNKVAQASKFYEEMSKLVDLIAGEDECDE